MRKTRSTRDSASRSPGNAVLALVAALSFAAFVEVNARELVAQDAVDARQLADVDVRPEPGGGGGPSIPPPTFRKPLFIRGDGNSDGVVNIADASSILNFLFQKGSSPDCMESANANGDSSVDVADAVVVLGHTFGIGVVMSPPEPGPTTCGPDPDDSSLSCDSYEFCADEFALINHVLNRITFGPTLELLTDIQSRAQLVSYIEAQLDNAPDNYEQALDEPDLAAQVDGLLIGFVPRISTPNDQYERLKAMLILNAIRSDWQLLHVVTHFWNNHFHTQIDTLRERYFRRNGRGGSASRGNLLTFNTVDTNNSNTITESEWDAFRATYPSLIYWANFGRAQIDDGIVEFDEFNNRNIAYWKYWRTRDSRGVSAEMEEREYQVFRQNAFGPFSDLLEQSAKSLAMLIYLNNFENTVTAPNENYGREYLELFGLGVDLVYTQKDIEEISKVLTGWTVSRILLAEFDPTDINFTGNPTAETFRINGRFNDPFEFPNMEFWDDSVYGWGYVLNLGNHDWSQKELFLQSYGGVDSLGNPVKPSDEVIIPNNPAQRTATRALNEFDQVHAQVMSFRDTAKFISTKLIQLFVTDDLTALAKTQEMPADLLALFNSVDTNLSETITRTEWEAPVPFSLPFGRPPHIFDQLDVNDDELITKLEYQEPDMLLEAIAAWQASGGEAREVLRAILLSDEFLSTKFFRAKIKTPFEVIASTFRALDGNSFPTQLLQAAEDLTLAGQELFDFADPTGESELGFDYMHTIGLLERLKYINRAVNAETPAEERMLWDAQSFISEFALTNGDRIVTFLTDLFLAGEILPEQRQLALDIYSSTGGSGIGRFEATAAYLMSLPQFQKQ